MACARQWFGAVAAALAGVDAADEVAVGMFFRYCLAGYDRPARELIADFLIGLERPPSAAELARLRASVALPPALVPVVTAPAWPVTAPAVAGRAGRAWVETAGSAAC